MIERAPLVSKAAVGAFAAYVVYIAVLWVAFGPERRLDYITSLYGGWWSHNLMLVLVWWLGFRPMSLLYMTEAKLTMSAQLCMAAELRSDGQDRHADVIDAWRTQLKQRITYCAGMILFADAVIQVVGLGAAHRFYWWLARGAGLGTSLERLGSAPLLVLTLAFWASAFYGSLRCRPVLGRWWVLMPAAQMVFATISCVYFFELPLLP